SSSGVAGPTYARGAARAKDLVTVGGSLTFVVRLTTLTLRTRGRPRLEASPSERSVRICLRAATHRRRNAPRARRAPYAAGPIPARRAPTPLRPQAIRGGNPASA